MLRRYTFWLTAAILFQFLAACLHILSLFAPHQINNDAERQMQELITTYRMDMGAGFHRTLGDLFTSVSTCYPLLCLLGGLTLGYLLIKHTEPALMKGLIAINLAIFTVCLIVFFFFAFLPPVLATGMIVVNLLAAYILVPKIESAIDV